MARETGSIEVLREAREKVTDLEAILLAECQMNPSVVVIKEARKLLPESELIALEEARYAWCQKESFKVGIAPILGQFPHSEHILLLASYWSTDPLSFLITTALPACPASIKLACRAAELTALAGDLAQAKVILERCRLQKNQSREREQLMAGLCALEAHVSTARLYLTPTSPYYLNLPGEGSNNMIVNPTAKVLLGQALKEMPWSGVLWHMAIALEPRQLRRSKLAEAQRRLEAVGADARAKALIAWTGGFITGEDGIVIAREIDPTFGDLYIGAGGIDGLEYSRNMSGPEYDRRMIQDRLYY